MPSDIQNEPLPESPRVEPDPIRRPDIEHPLATPPWGGRMRPPLRGHLTLPKISDCYNRYSMSAQLQIDKTAGPARLGRRSPLTVPFKPQCSCRLAHLLQSRACHRTFWKNWARRLSWAIPTISIYG